MRPGAHLLHPPVPSEAPSTPPLRLAAGGAGPLVDAAKGGAGVGRLLRRRPAVLHRVPGHCACPSDPRQVHHVRGDVALREGHAYLQEMEELGRDSSWGPEGRVPTGPGGSWGPAGEEAGSLAQRCKVGGGSLTSWSLQMARSATLPQWTRTTSKQRSGSQP